MAHIDRYKNVCERLTYAGNSQMNGNTRLSTSDCT